tara:strand:+ start:69 stop:965 length:897 start_codon:yes stop_codon:yes gene_type:complete
MNKISNLRSLNEEHREEFGVLLLLDQIMRFDLLQLEKKDLEKVIDELDGIIAKLNKGFFKSEEQDEDLNFQKEELIQAEEALSQVEKEIDENEKFRINIALIEKDEEKLEPLLKFMEEKNILTVGSDNFYQPTKKGRDFYYQLVEQLESYVIHFDVFAYVDLENGVFGDPNQDFLEGDQWSDLRVAVSEFKGIDPFRVVFLAMMSEEKFFENPDWKFDLGLGTLFDDLEKIVQDQLEIDDLGYEDEGEIVTGEDVIKDIFKQGQLLAKERNLNKIENKKSIEIAEIPDEKILTKNYYW